MIWITQKDQKDEKRHDSNCKSAVVGCRISLVIVSSLCALGGVTKGNISTFVHLLFNGLWPQKKPPVSRVVVYLCFSGIHNNFSTCIREVSGNMKN